MMNLPNIVLRQYRNNGPYYAIEVENNDIITSYRLDEFPDNWPESFIQERLELGKRMFSFKTVT
ncbi:hypothetical protein [Paenibacillus thiaminolyticus]|uniref:hypothetical protein n=1 Tax=Paenibacillus thiaminolyticus TaxID=49283 RepID=UPI0011C4707E|nr:hypothetical protein [Paenibacillus thiaminolyticus]